MIIRAFVFFMLAVVSGGASAQAPAFDMADVIRVSAAKHAATQKVDAGSAVKRMDDLLVRDYGARGRIASERDPRLKSLYTQAARLLMNGNAPPRNQGSAAVRLDRHYRRSSERC